MTSIMTPRSIIKNIIGIIDILFVNDSSRALKLRTGTCLVEVEPSSDELSVLAIDERKLKHLSPRSCKNLRDILLKY